MELLELLDYQTIQTQVDLTVCTSCWTYMDLEGENPQRVAVENVETQKN